ncbi:MAG: ABC transporter permease [Sporomusaceae bacterium]|nr:ABC transporter permease [Sporomusaceae bacterium]
MEALLKKTAAASPGQPARWSRLGRTTAKIVVDKLSIVLFLLLWELASRLDLLSQTFIAAPSIMLATLGELIVSGVLLEHIRVSFIRAITGFALAAAVGVPLGFLLGGRFRLLERIMTPLLRLLTEINPFSLFPVFIVLFGIGEFSKVAMIFWVCLWPILLNTITGIKQVDPLLLKSASSMGVEGRDLFVKVILPAASPQIFHGVQTGCGVAFFMLIASEMIGASSGLGWLVFNSQINYQIPRLFATTFMISLLGLSLNYLFVLLEGRLLNWKENTPQY